ncbi:MAG: murein biosynthesis integral membrane protein MurJ, partial [bacterium]
AEPAGPAEPVGRPSPPASGGGGQGRLVRAAGWVSLLTMVSRVLGMVRDMVVAALFTKTTTDAFFVAFTIPNVLRRLLAEGTLTVAFIPIFTDSRENVGEQESREFLNAAWTSLAIVLLVVSALGVLAAPWLVYLFAGGYADEPAKFALAVRLTQVMFPYIFFVSLMALCMGALNTVGHFTAPAVAPVLLNVLMIGCTVALWRPLQSAGYNPVYGLAVGVIAGGAAQLLLQLPVMARRGYLPRLRLHLRHPGVVQMAKLMAPAVFGLALYQVNVVLARLLASFLADGTVTYLYYSQRLIELPMGIFAVAVATAAMPALSRHAASGDLAQLKEVYADSLRLNLFVVIPAMVGLLVVGEPIIAVIFERGRFTPAMTHETYRALFGFAVSLWAAAGIRLTVPVFFALQDSKTPVKVALVALVAYVGAGLAMMWPLQHLGLALAISLSSVVNFTLLVILLRRRLGRLGLRKVVGSAARALAASAVMGAVAWGGCRLMARPGFGRGFGRAAVLLGAVTVAGFVYFGAAALLRCPELSELWRALRRRGNRPAQGSE